MSDKPTAPAVKRERSIEGKAAARYAYAGKTVRDLVAGIAAIRAKLAEKEAALKLAEQEVQAARSDLDKLSSM